MLNKYGNTLNWELIDKTVQNKNLRRLISLGLGIAKVVLEEQNYIKNIKGMFTISDPYINYYMKMMFYKGQPSIVKIKSKLLKIGLPATLVGRLKCYHTFYLIGIE